MRLIDTSTLILHEFFDSDIPQYAILSHTWGPEEVSFQEWVDLTDTDGCQCGKSQRREKIQSKAGYQKVVACCRQAQKDHFQYLWADTCCIDKSSSAEISEAINSMFRWYEKSFVCYVYLADVAAQKPYPVAKRLSWVSDFEKSRWFQRGWTLQELIAPLKIVFFASDWVAIAMKDHRSIDVKCHPPDLLNVLSKITKIGENALAGWPLQSFSVAQRMSWAANRQTTRVEDIAYCLLGIFNVNMPMLYGEGHKAFQRLQEALIKTSDDQSLFAWTGEMSGFSTRELERWNGLYSQRNRARSLSEGVLAESPADFSKSQNIRPFFPLPSKSSQILTSAETPLHRVQTYQINHNGLQINIPVARHKIYGAVALLYCAEFNGGSPASRIGLRLEPSVKWDKVAKKFPRHDDGAARIGILKFDNDWAEQFEEFELMTLFLKARE